MHDPRLTTSSRGVRVDSASSSKAVAVSGAVAFNPGVHRRRNGLQPACEPCRKAKVRCDTTPLESICARCRKRKSPSQCIFLDAPMSHSKAGATSNGIQLDFPRQAPTQAPTQAPSLLGKITSPASISEQLEERGPESSGFFGSTSFSATIQQTNMATDPPLVGGELASMNSKPQQDPAKLSLGVKTLSFLPDERTCRTFLNWYLSNSSEVGFHKPSVVHCFESMWSTYGECLQLPRRLEGLESMAKEIFRNGNVELKPLDDTAEWMASYSGSNTRWETVGIIFIAFGYGVLSLPEIQLAPIIKAGAKKDRKSFLTEIKECVEICVGLCRHSLNNIVCNLLYKNLLFETVLYGDSSKFILLI
jgi:Fungal Zn(2)-Cys(6) binuclear cluster domain